MISMTTPTIQIEQNVERRRALGKVYRLLIKLAEKTEDKSLHHEVVEKEKEESVEPTPVQLELL